MGIIELQNYETGILFPKYSIILDFNTIILTEILQ